MVKDALREGKSAMDKALQALRRDIARIRTGRASITLLDDIRVDYYGTPTPLSQVANLSVPEPRLIVIQPWEKKLISDIERAIFKSDLGLNPSSDGQIIRLPIPALTEERRKEMAKQVRRIGEEAKISIRGARRDLNETLKLLEKDKEINLDEMKQGEKDVQQLTDEYVAKVDGIVKDKEQELMEI
ncbi:ribosome recycling factor [Geopsychrobacter electrodiphilus]|uniref:ribosome recycling factor n=1 Tax=Geopsychrobacter electrodiphilus TaxID=225196 RepID=UPI0003742422|nr:ribosome recycling factor [Geopsychrobacter electrodiphilus]